ncbi:MAG TPA: hypothetical protein VG455_01175 [Acidimicrobiales bacterium]|nr:hypothetical protein [Acidimicrobiales bacterium]
MIRLDAATVLLQWATGGLLFLWVTSRRRQVGLGYGWLLRGVYGALAAGAVVAGGLVDPDPVRDVCAALVAVAAGVALAVSLARRRAGVAGERARRERRSARVAAMVGQREGRGPGHSRGPGGGSGAADARPAEFPPALDLVAPALGAVGLVAAGLAAGEPATLAVVRNLVGAAFLGVVSDAMLLGHWYLVQPGLARDPIFELNRWLMGVWPVEVAALLWPTGMASVLTGAVDDGWGGTLGWFWVACAVTTIVLAVVTHAALKERAYSAVMAATGLLYLAILTAFGTDLVARAVLAG